MVGVRTERNTLPGRNGEKGASFSFIEDCEASRTGKEGKLPEGGLCSSEEKVWDSRGCASPPALGLQTLTLTAFSSLKILLGNMNKRLIDLRAYAHSSIC